MGLEVQIKKRFKDFSLEVSLFHEGRCLGILGASGSGKSMTLKCIAGIEKPDEGRIVLQNKVLYDSQIGINKKPQERKIGYLFQNYALFPNMTVRDNIGVGIRLPKEEKTVIVQEYLERFQLQGLGNRYPQELSGGQQQRVALARIMVYYPDMILLDEPFSALDSCLRDSLQWELMNLLKDYKGEVILVSHNRDEIYKFSDRLSVMATGKQLLNGYTKEIFKNPKQMEAARLTGCKNISPIKILGEYELRALDWEISLKTSIPIGPNVRYVGIRAHNIEASKDREEENTIPVCGKGYTETVSEYEVLLQNRESANSKEICWRITKQNSGFDGQSRIPNYITMPKGALMLLE